MGSNASKPEDGQKKHADKGIDGLSVVLAGMRKLQTKPKNIVQVKREALMASAVSYFKQVDCEHYPVEILMSSDGVPEQSQDLGGPTREFFTLLFKEFLRKDIDMFEGQAHGRNLFPVNNEKAISAGLFTLLGKAIVISLVSGGPGFPYLAPCIVSYLRGRDFDHEINICYVYNTVLRQLIKRINNATTNEQLEEALDSDTDKFIDNCGWPRCQMITMNNRLQLTQSLLKWELIGKRAAALDQLRKGVNSLGFLDKTTDIPDADGYLIQNDTEKVTAEYLRKCLRRKLDQLEAKDEKEENAKRFTLACMEMMTDEEATNLFHFMTGMSSLPVEEIPLEVEFNRMNKSAEFPEAVTCIQRLRIPLGNDSQMAFYSSFHKALSVGRYGFGGKE